MSAAAATTQSQTETVDDETNPYSREEDQEYEAYAHQDEAMFSMWAQLGLSVSLFPIQKQAQFINAFKTLGKSPDQTIKNLFNFENPATYQIEAEAENTARDQLKKAAKKRGKNNPISRSEKVSVRFLTQTASLSKDDISRHIQLKSLAQTAQSQVNILEKERCFDVYSERYGLKSLEGMSNRLRTQVEQELRVHPGRSFEDVLTSESRKLYLEKEAGEPGGKKLEELSKKEQQAKEKEITGFAAAAKKGTKNARVEAIRTMELRRGKVQGVLTRMQTSDISSADRFAVRKYLETGKDDYLNTPTIQSVIQPTPTLQPAQAVPATPPPAQPTATITTHPPTVATKTLNATTQKQSIPQPIATSKQSVGRTLFRRFIPASFRARFTSYWNRVSTLQTRAFSFFRNTTAVFTARNSLAFSVRFLRTGLRKFGFNALAKIAPRLLLNAGKIALGIGSLGTSLAIQAALEVGKRLPLIGGVIRVAEGVFIQSLKLGLAVLIIIAVGLPFVFIVLSTTASTSQSNIGVDNARVVEINTSTTISWQEFEKQSLTRKKNAVLSWGEFEKESLLPNNSAVLKDDSSIVYAP